MRRIRGEQTRPPFGEGSRGRLPTSGRWERWRFWPFAAPEVPEERVTASEAGAGCQGHLPTRFWLHGAQAAACLDLTIS